MRVALDTNVLLAAFAARGLCEALLGACLQSHTIVLSDYILAELSEHLATKLRMQAKDIREIDALLREHSELVRPEVMAKALCPDPDDLPVLGTAVAGKVEALVTGDAALLRVGTIMGIPIISPRAFYDRLAASQ